MTTSAKAERHCATPSASMKHATAKQSEVSSTEEPPKVRKTFGRIPHNGRIFVVPQTHDMVSTLLSPSTPKKAIDIFILGVLIFHISLYFTLPTAFRTPILLLLFLFWRTSYNFGLGYLLRAQSKYGQLVYWAKKYGIFDSSQSPTIYSYIRSDIESKVREEVRNGDYKFDKAPIEYNTWLVFRRVVDLILMCDFVSYVVMAMSCAHQPDNEEWYLTLGRWVGGFVLFVFNLWVKLDAHRVVKDYAWYWGDFFFLIDQNLTFDGVYEIAPHPMYSVGYAGYYGISLLAASYTVLGVSLIAHAAQFTFLTAVENPHIEKTYNPPTSRKKSKLHEVRLLDGDIDASASVFNDPCQPLSERPLVQSLDPWNSIHFSSILLAFYLAAITILTPSTCTYQMLFILHALSWRLWHTIGIGTILVGQSNNKSYVRHFLKFGKTREAAWRHWKGVYFVSLSMTHSSFVAAAWKQYQLPQGDDRMVLFRHIVGIMLVALQVWTAFSIHESLGEFGWFYGDFFFDLPSPHLTYSGIYRYFNNPERLIGCAGIWGIVLMASSAPIFLVGLFSHVCALLFLNVVESPHMQKLYGSQIRREAGVAKTIRNAIPPPVADQVRMFQGSVDKIVHETTEFIEELLERSRPRLPKAVIGVVKNTQARFAPARLAIQLLSDNDSVTTKHEAEKYSLDIITAVRRGDSETLTVPYGEPIHVSWKAPLDHSNKDWIGLYKIADNSSREVTSVTSVGRWIAVCKDQYDAKVADHGIIYSNQPDENEPDRVRGEVVFQKEKLFWKNGVYEFRYHHDRKHSILAISQPFEICVEKVGLDDKELRGGAAREIVEKHLLPIVQRCFDEEGLAPVDMDDIFGGSADDICSRRVVYAIREMFGVDLAPSVVKADGNVRRLGWRICNARKVLKFIPLMVRFS
ncbi:phosphatidylethanolamine N-methyltransferase [Wilcoxina mikolae CBS 423.85]|nr:phosphatidylethanolamine N-methyltransferase [Wilcoxina mikolae CBS 423.85]